MEKTPLIPIQPMELDIWHEDGAVVVADKPKGLKVAPDAPTESATLANALLGSNRWLAEMQTSLRPGIIYGMSALDRGLVVVAKSDESVGPLRDSYQAGQFSFSYRVVLPADLPVPDHQAVTIVDRQEYGQRLVLDIDSTIGDSQVLRRDWLGIEPHDPNEYFVLYRVDIPLKSQPVTVALGQRIALPTLELFTVPP